MKRNEPFENACCNPHSSTFLAPHSPKKPCRYAVSEGSTECSECPAGRPRHVEELVAAVPISVLMTPLPSGKLT